MRSWSRILNTRGQRSESGSRKEEMGKKPADRVKTLLGKLKSMRRSKERGYNISEEIRHTSNKFVGRVEKIFKNLPKPLEWRSFYNNDLPLLMDICEEVQRTEVGDRRSEDYSLRPRVAKLENTVPWAKIGKDRKKKCVQFRGQALFSVDVKMGGEIG